jgi:UDP-sugar pyrophosphorylase
VISWATTNTSLQRLVDGPNSMASFPSWFLGEGASIQDAKTVQLLIDLGQEHLLGTPSPAGTDDSSVDAETLAARRTLLEQVRALDAKYPGGLEAYVVKSRKLLHEARTGINPFIKLKPAQPECEALPFAGKAFLEAEARGLQEASSACFVLVAGGLGERLGYSGIKLALPTETCTMTCFLELFARNLLAIQRHANTASTDARPSSPFDNASEPPTKKARDNQSNKSVGIPLLIMTSNDTHERTQELLEANNYFGLDPAQVDLLMQDKVASIQDVEGRFAVDLSEPSKCPPILTKPHGHGDVHLLLHQSGIARKWLGEGKRWVVFFQDTNANVFRTLIPGIGVSAGRGFDGNFVAVPRKAKSASGAIMRLSDPSRDTTTTNNNSNDSKPAGTLNVEYNYVDDVLRAHGYPDGDVNVPGDGGDYSAFPGNTNQLVISLDVYVPVLEGSSGLIPEFVNPKYSDSDKRMFKPTRLECMMQVRPMLADYSRHKEPQLAQLPRACVESGCASNSAENLLLHVGQLRCSIWIFWSLGRSTEICYMF